MGPFSECVKKWNCSQPSSFVHGILQARILDWAAVPFSKGSPPSRDWTRVSFIASEWAMREAPPFSGEMVFRYQRVVFIAVDLFQWTLHVYLLGDYMYIYYYMNKFTYLYENIFNLYLLIKWWVHTDVFNSSVRLRFFLPFSHSLFVFFPVAWTLVPSRISVLKLMQK